MRLLFLILGTILSGVFLVAMARGRKNDYMLEPLNSDAFPLKGISTAGLTIQNVKFFRLHGKLGAKLRESTSLYYGPKFGEYYAQMVWAQVLSYSMLCLSLFLLLAGALNGAFFAVAGIVLGAAVAYYFFTYTRGKVNVRREKCETEFPNAISKLALLVNSGLVLREAWNKVAYGKEGVFYDMMQDACQEMENGKSDIDAIYAFGAKSASAEIKKFTSALVQSLERGGGELTIFLANQSTELWNFHRQVLLQKGERAASSLLAPIALMFVAVILLILAAALQSFSL